jgi:hypothetical protein
LRRPRESGDGPSSGRGRSASQNDASSHQGVLTAKRMSTRRWALGDGADLGATWDVTDDDEGAPSARHHVRQARPGRHRSRSSPVWFAWRLASDLSCHSRLLRSAMVARGASFLKENITHSSYALRHSDATPDLVPASGRSGACASTGGGLVDDRPPLSRIVRECACPLTR